MRIKKNVEKKKSMDQVLTHVKERFGSWKGEHRK